MLGFILLSVIIFFIFVGIIASVSSKDEVIVKENSVLFMKLDKPIVDRSPKSPFADMDFTSFNPTKPVGLNEIIRNIKKASNDDNIKGIYLELGGILARISTIEEVRDALIRFKESGKFIITYSEGFTQSSYYLSTVSDKIYFNKEGYFDFHGLSGQVAFVKGTLEKLDIKAQIIRGPDNKYKSAVEPLIYDQMSEGSKEQTLAYVSIIWNHMLKGINETRDISIDNLNKVADKLLIQSPEDAVTYNFVDSLIYKDELLDILRNRLDLKEKSKIQFMTLSKYDDVKPAKKKRRSKNKIAIVYAYGGIESGNGDDKTIGSERISKAIRCARLDSTVKAIVLRVNSPGGSALASEVIWREVDLAAKAKPFVASMGDYAASGGYYISCAADTIVASENTLTGSIGVFGVLFNFGDFFENKLGIKFDKVQTNDYGDFGNIMRPLSEYEHQVIQKYIKDIYYTFIDHVAKGRNMKAADVDSIAQGRVWAGTDAKEQGLVDVIGGLKESIDIAVYMAKLEDFRLVEYPKQKDPLTEIIEQLKGNASASAIQNELGENYKYYEFIKSISNMEGIQARLPYMIEVK